MRYSVLLILMLCFNCKPKDDLPETILLHDKWVFKKVSDSIWNSVALPGNIHSDLLENQFIEDPFIGDNEKNMEWISKTDWEYKTTFLLDEKILEKKYIELNFEGLDTYASVYLNDSLILKANNAFKSWNVDVKSLLNLDNKLRILFESTSKVEEAEATKLSYKLPVGDRVFTRKAQFQYGWDWAPELNTSGVWRPVKLVTWNDYKIENIHIVQNSLTDSVANLSLQIENHSSSVLDKELSYEVFVNNELIVSTDLMLTRNSEHINFHIENPRLWWPHNLGEPYLYDIKVLVKDGHKILDSSSEKIGLRSINLITEKDSIGESFYFKVNDVPVYIKGANYVPQNSLQNKVTDRHYKKLLCDVVDANMNMLRVWGGGIYENDIFYELCDEKGILVWQDFMFACAMYPGDTNFLESVKQEAETNVKRLRNHASIALWCGNNENSEGWKRWGWQANRIENEKEEIWSNYLKVFDSILPRTVAEFTDTDYWETSPQYGRGNPKYKVAGDAHDWWIWHDAYPFEHLEENIPRFMSEFGFQGFPGYETIRYINQSDTLNISSEGFKNHQKHTRGFQLIDDYMRRDFPVPDCPEDYVYMSQLLQAYGITKGIEAQRRAKPYNMGTLYWQLNDCWPVVSWSSIDFMGNWKALHYKTKRRFEDILISSKVEKNSLEIWLINDDMESKKGLLSMQIMDFNGKIIWQDSQIINVEALSSAIKYHLDLSTISFNRDETVLVSKFKNQSINYFFAKPKELKLKSSEIKKKITENKEGFAIELTSEMLQKDVFLFTNTKGHFSDNFIDILPHQSVVIHFKTESKRLDDLQLKSFNNFIR